MSASLRGLVKIIIFITAGLLFLYLQRFFPNPALSDKAWKETLVSYRVVESNGVLENIWSRSSLFVNENRGVCLPFIVAGQEKVFVIGEFDQAEDDTVLALNASDGTQAWRYDNWYGFTGLFLTSTTLYSGSSGNATLTAYDLDTGHIFWSRSMLPWSRYIRCFRVSNDLIYVETNTARYLIDANSGKVLQTFDQVLSSQALEELATQFGLPPEQIQQEYFEKAVFDGDVIIKDGEAIDRQTGDLLWKIDGVISNVAAMNSVVYLLTKDRKLLGLKSRTGEVTASVQFEPIPTTVRNHGFDQAFYVAVDAEAGMVYTFLGDGAELFAFKVVKD